MKIVKELDTGDFFVILDAWEIMQMLPEEIERELGKNWTDYDCDSFRVKAKYKLADEGYVEISSRDVLIPGETLDTIIRDSESHK